MTIETWLALVRGIFYVFLVALVLLDVPLVERYHKVLLATIAVFFGVLVSASTALALGNVMLYTALRDYGATVALAGIVVAHLIWRSKRNRKDKDK